MRHLSSGIGTAILCCVYNWLSLIQANSEILRSIKDRYCKLLLCYTTSFIESAPRVESSMIHSKNRFRLIFWEVELVWMDRCKEKNVTQFLRQV